ncbi:MAG: circadian clock protein KaiB [Candidatus Kuenenia sp.]|nr:circadian clock protein KaiB [Candidatus Kuenenia hertensis]
MKYVLKLYISGETERAKTAKEEAYVLSNYYYNGGYEIELEIVDISKNLTVVKSEGVFVTPTLERIFPPPRRRVIGQFSDVEKVFSYLEIE